MSKVKVLNYKKVTEYETRQNAIDFFNEALFFSAGSEQERYLNILQQLKYTNNDFVYDLEEDFKNYKNKEEKND